MFLIANFALKKSNIVKSKSVQTYSIAVGIVFYAAIYMYLLFSKSEFLSVFNRFVIYIIGVDLLLSALFFSNASQKPDVVVHDINNMSNEQFNQYYPGFNNNKPENSEYSEDSEGTDDSEDDEPSENSLDSEENEVPETNDKNETDNNSEHSEQSVKSEANHTENKQNDNLIVNEHPQMSVEEFKDDLETLVLDNELVQQLEDITPQGPKKRGRKPKATVVA